MDVTSSLRKLVNDRYTALNLQVAMTALGTKLPRTSLKRIVKISAVLVLPALPGTCTGYENPKPACPNLHSK